MSSPQTDPKSDSRASRRFPRHKLDVRVSVSVFRAGENLSFWGRSSELGEDGIGATLTGELEPGEVVEEAAPVAVRVLAVGVVLGPDLVRDLRRVLPQLGLLRVAHDLHACI